MKSLVRVTDASTEPVTLAEAQAFLRVDSDDDSTLITTLITTARQIVEDFTGRALISQTWKLTQSEWPSGCYDAGRMIELERSPLISVESVKYYPADGTALATLATSAYITLTGPQPGIVYLKVTQDWPAVYERPDAVEVNFTAGYATAAAVPRPLYHAVLLLIAHLYELRTPVNVGNIVTEIPYSIKHLLESYRVGGWVA